MIRKRSVAITLLLSVGCLTLYFRPEVVWGFQHSFFPVPSKWIYSGVFFMLGALLAVHDFDLSWLKGDASRFAAPAIVFAVSALALGRWHLQGGSNDLASVSLAITTCLSATMITLTIIGITAKYVPSVPVSISYLSAGSFWVYMIHHPILGLIHTDLKWLLPTTSPIVKVALSFVVTSALSLAIYEVAVRKTALGRMLGFQWKSPDRLAKAAVSATEAGTLSFETRRDSDNAPTSAPTRRAA
jgi:peptidoglycan/LPS O-acetylase OafA/YrhL